MEFIRLVAATHGLEPLRVDGDIMLKFVMAHDKLIVGDIRDHWKLMLVGLRPDGLTTCPPMTTELARHLALKYEVQSAGDIHRDGRITFCCHEVYAELGLIPSVHSRERIERLIRCLVTELRQESLPLFGIPVQAPELFGVPEFRVSAEEIEALIRESAQPPS